MSTSDTPPRAGARVDVLGVGISTIDPDDALNEIASWIATGRHEYVCVTGMHGVMEAQGDPELVRIHNASGLTTPDGMPMVWCAHYAGAANVQRVYGPDLMLAVSQRAAKTGWRCYLYGGATDEVLDQLRANLEAKFPGLQIAGAYSPPFRPLTDEEDAAVEAINASAADIVWVGLSTPKQERWMAAHIGHVNAAALIGVGAAFDIHAGNAKQAPKWMQRSGLEWLFRLASEPRRLWRRYVINIPRFLFTIARRRPRLVPASAAEAVVQQAS